MTVILGIDPGSRKTGFGLISVDRNKPHYVSSGTIHLPSKEPLSVRLKVLFESLTEVIDTYQPQVAAIERVFVAKSADSALKLGQARGAAMVACVMKDLVVYEYAAPANQAVGSRYWRGQQATGATYGDRFTGLVG